MSSNVPQSFVEAEKRIKDEVDIHRKYSTALPGLVLKRLLLVDSVDQMRLERLRAVLLDYKFTHYDFDYPTAETFFMLSRFMEDGKKSYDDALRNMLIAIKHYSQVSKKGYFGVVFVPTRDRRDILRVLDLCDDRIHVPTFNDDDILPLVSLMQCALLSSGCDGNKCNLFIREGDTQTQKDVGEFYKGCILEEIYEHVCKAYVACCVHGVPTLTVDILLKYGAIHEGSRRYSYSAFETEKNLDFYEPPLEPDWDSLRKGPELNEVVEEPETDHLPPKKKRKRSPGTKQ